MGASASVFILVLPEIIKHHFPSHLLNFCRRAFLSSAQNPRSFSTTKEPSLFSRSNTLISRNNDRKIKAKWTAVGA